MVDYFNPILAIAAQVRKDILAYGKKIGWPMDKPLTKEFWDGLDKELYHGR